MSGHDHDQARDHGGLARDLDTLLRTTADRRQALRWLGLAGAGGAVPLTVLGCGGSEGTSSTSGTLTATSTSTSTSTTTTTAGTGSAACSVIPEETAGPYPGDGSNTNSQGIANALLLSGIVRSDLRPSLGSSGTTAQGMPLTVRLQLVNAAGSCASLAGYAIYLWHCDRDGKYSMYDLVNENYLRGVQVTDSSGAVSFTTIYPGCYLGRMPHMHFEVYPSLAKATSAAGKVKTSQIAFPTATSTEAYTATGYSTSASNATRISFATDNVFSDGTNLQMATMTGNAVQGYTATLTVAINA